MVSQPAILPAQGDRDQTGGEKREVGRFCETASVHYPLPTIHYFSAAYRCGLPLNRDWLASLENM